MLGKLIEKILESLILTNVALVKCPGCDKNPVQIPLKKELHIQRSPISRHS